MICIAAANAGGTSQDLKTGYLIGATPRYQQLALFVGAIVAAAVIGATVKLLDLPTPDMLAHGIEHQIGTTAYPAPQGTLMATLIKGLLSFDLDWQFVLVGVFLAIAMELCGVNALCFAVGVYLPLSTTLPIFAGGVVRAGVNRRTKGRQKQNTAADEDLGSGNLFATGLVAGGALAGVIIAGLIQIPALQKLFPNLSVAKLVTTMLGEGGYQLLGAAFFIIMGLTLYRVAVAKRT
jgi:putative OPT family oligopeptide transporter